MGYRFQISYIHTEFAACWPVLKQLSHEQPTSIDIHVPKWAERRHSSHSAFTSEYNRFDLANSPYSTLKAPMPVRPARRYEPSEALKRTSAPIRGGLPSNSLSVTESEGQSVCAKYPCLQQEFKRMMVQY